MKIIFSVLWLSMLIVVTACTSYDITEKMVVDSLAEFDKAVEDKDVEKSASYMSDDIAITIYVTSNGNIQTIISNKKEYISKTKQAYSTVDNYRYNRIVGKIEIDSEVANVTSIIEEQWVIEGKESSASTREKSTLKLVNGKLLTIKLLSATEI